MKEQNIDVKVLTSRRLSTFVVVLFLQYIQGSLVIRRKTGRPTGLPVRQWWSTKLVETEERERSLTLEEDSLLV